jgi:uncharacterized protein YbjT (DUF2867 family)
MNLLVTGASGFVGGHLCRHFVERGHEVVALSRRGDAPAGTTPVRGDVASGEGLPEALNGIEAVVHLVGIIRETGEASFEEVHLEGTRKVLAATARASVRRYLHMSALGAREGSKSGYAHTKARAEALVEASTLDWTIFRPSLIFGPGDDFFSNVMKNLVTGYPLVIPQIGAGQFPFRPVWIGDVARVFEQSLAKPKTIGKSYELVGPTEYSFVELVELVKRTLSVKKPRLPVPVPIMKLVVPAMRILPKPPITKDELVMLLEGNTGDLEEVAKTFDLELRSLEAELPKILADA